MKVGELGDVGVEVDVYVGDGGDVCGCGCRRKNWMDWAEPRGGVVGAALS